MKQCIDSAEHAAGRLASEALAQAAAKLQEAKLGSHVRIPPLPPTVRAHAFVRGRRESLWVGGWYRKLTRCLAFAVCLLWP